jgi:hypothetical protein
MPLQIRLFGEFKIHRQDKIDEQAKADAGAQWIDGSQPRL